MRGILNSSRYIRETNIYIKTSPSIGGTEANA